MMCPRVSIGFARPQFVPDSPWFHRLATGKIERAIEDDVHGRRAGDDRLSWLVVAKHDQANYAFRWGFFYAVRHKEACVVFTFGLGLVAVETDEDPLAVRILALVFAFDRAAPPDLDPEERG